MTPRAISQRGGGETLPCGFPSFQPPSVILPLASLYRPCTQGQCECRCTASMTCTAESVLWRPASQTRAHKPFRSAGRPSNRPGTRRRWASSYSLFRPAPAQRFRRRLPSQAPHQASRSSPRRRPSFVRNFIFVFLMHFWVLTAFLASTVCGREGFPLPQTEPKMHQPTGEIIITNLELATRSKPLLTQHTHARSTAAET